MFLGHFAAGLCAKKIYGKPSLGTYFLAVQFLDLLWPTFLLTGIEEVAINKDATRGLPLSFTYYPWSHSLLMVLVWSFVFGLVYWLLKKDSKGAIVLSLFVLSHWFIDLIVHIPDLPLYPGNSPLYGLGLWRFFILELLIEILLFIIGLRLYLTSTKATNKKGLYAFSGLAIFLILIQLASSFSDAPPNVGAIAWAGHLQWLLVILAYWADANRSERSDELQLA